MSTERIRSERPDARHISMCLDGACARSSASVDAIQVRRPSIRTGNGHHMVIVVVRDRHNRVIARAQRSITLVDAA
jgi:hypothetical protein